MLFRYIDLFAGMGGIRLGLEQALAEKGIKGECVLTSEIKPYALKVYKDNFGDENIKGDVSQIEGKDIPDFDMLLAGFPCFAGDTLIFTSARRFVPISEISIGDFVMTHTGQFCEVKEVMSRTVNKYYTVYIQTGLKIKATENHPFYIKKSRNDNPEWVSVKDMQPNMFVGFPIELIKWYGEEFLYGFDYFMEDGYYWCPIDKKPRVSNKELKVYNLAVAEDNSYLAYGFAVHNCQPFSMAGKRAGFEDTRGTLFFEIARILKEKQPKYFLLENVENLVSHDLSKENKKLGITIGRTLETILTVLGELGYKVTWKVIEASDYGVAQARRRIYIVGCKDKFISLDDFKKEYKTFGEVQEKGLSCIYSDFSKRLFKYLDENNLDISFLYDKAIRDKRGSDNNIHSWDLGLRGDLNQSQKDFMDAFILERRKKSLAEEKGLVYKEGIGLSKKDLENIYKGKNFEKDFLELLNLRYIKEKSIDFYSEKLYDINGGKLSYEFAKILDPNKPCLTLVATDVGKFAVVDGKGIRKLTLREGLRLNGYPEEYNLNIDYTKGMDLLGNTVVVPIIKMICDRVLENEVDERSDGCE